MGSDGSEINLMRGGSGGWCTLCPSGRPNKLLGLAWSSRTTSWSARRSRQRECVEIAAPILLSLVDCKGTADTLLRWAGTWFNGAPTAAWCLFGHTVRQRRKSKKDQDVFITEHSCILPDRYTENRLESILYTGYSTEAKTTAMRYTVSRFVRSNGEDNGYSRRVDESQFDDFEREK